MSVIFIDRGWQTPFRRKIAFHAFFMSTSLFRNDDLIEDFVTGQKILNTERERSTTQLFTKLLCFFYGYAKEHIRTHPPYLSNYTSAHSKCPKPMDIALFSDQGKVCEEKIMLVGICNQKTSVSERSVTERFMRFSDAEYGVFFVKRAPFFIRKKLAEDGTCFFEDIANIPYNNQSLWDFGKVRKKDLKPNDHLVLEMEFIFNRLSYPHGNSVKSPILVAEGILDLLLCKYVDEKYSSEVAMMNFRTLIDEEPQIVRQRVDFLFEQVKFLFPHLFCKGQRLQMDEDDIRFAVGQLQYLDIMNSSIESLENALRWLQAKSGIEDEHEKVPSALLKKMIEYAGVSPNSSVCIPRSGGFDLPILCCDRIGDAIRKLSAQNKFIEPLCENALHRSLHEINIFEDSPISAKIYQLVLARHGYSEPTVFLRKNCFDTGKYDFVLTIIPKSMVAYENDKNVLGNYSIAHHHRMQHGVYTEYSHVRKSVPTAFLFIEDYKRLLKCGGCVCVVMPKKYLVSQSYCYFHKYLLQSDSLYKVINLQPDENDTQSCEQCKMIALVLWSSLPKQDIL